MGSPQTSNFTGKFHLRFGILGAQQANQNISSDLGKDPALEVANTHINNGWIMQENLEFLPIYGRQILK